MIGIAPVVLEEYSNSWPLMFQKEKQLLHNAVGAYIVSIEHIGSTAISGSVAKPEIDIMCGVHMLVDAEHCIEPLKKLGYAYFPQFEQFVPERRYFRKSDGITPLFHIHAVETKSNFWREHLTFRDALRAQPSVVQEYNQLKKSLLEQFPGDRKSYSKGKEAFVQRILGA